MKLTPLKQGLQALSDGYKAKPTELERDGLIQRFEFCVELCWKSAKKVLESSGIVTDTPKNTFRHLAKIGWIDDPEPWLGFIDARNKASHIYNKEVAEEVFSVIKIFMAEAAVLVKVLEKNLK